MPGLFGMGGPATVALAVVVLLVALVLALPAGRGAVARSPARSRDGRG